MKVDVAVVGGGPAGAMSATLLARQGLEVVLLERAPAWRWRACGVFTSPATVMGLRRIGLTADEVARVARPIPAMRVETERGTSFDLSYGGTGALGDSPVGLDRAALDPLLLTMATSAGVAVRRGTAVTAVALPGVGGRDHDAGTELTLASGERLSARIVVGADGPRSLVAAAAGVARAAPLGHRTGLTFHIPDGSDGDAGTDDDVSLVARMAIIRHGYVGLAPVPGRRTNVGIVLGKSWLPILRRDGAAAVARSILGRVLPTRTGEPPAILDQVAGASPLGAAARRRAGPGWLIVGDAAGFLDPFTGEGVQRAIVSSELATETIVTEWGARWPRLNAYDRAMRARFGRKDQMTRISQALLGQPLIFEYAARRLATRSHLRETMGLVIGDLLPATRALHPRFLAALLAP